MKNMHKSTIALVLLCTSLGAQNTLTVPAAFDAVDAPSRLWVAGVSVDLRQQTIIDARHLVPLVGHPITGLWWRRDAANEAFTGGTTTLSVSIGTTTADSLSASETYASNLPNATLVFSGPLQVPNAPPDLTGSWAADRTIRVAFNPAFTYTGGNLAVDVVGLADPVQPIAWWPADCAWDGAIGTVQSVGAGCGVHVNGNGEWASAVARSLLPGATAEFSARGTENGIALLCFGSLAQAPGQPLSAFLPGATPGCNVYVQVPMATMITSFASVPFPGEGGTALCSFPIPNQVWALGASFGSQWVDVQQQFATSNGVNSTVSATAPSLGMCVVRGVPGDPTGSVLTNQAHVLRFTYQ
jgi:hypothetical protein